MEFNKEFATLALPEKDPIQIPVITDNMGDKSIDVRNLRRETGYITYDPGFVNTVSFSLFQAEYKWFSRRNTNSFSDSTF